MSDIARNDEWNSDRPQEERKYDGPAGMDPDGVIDSNWDEVGDHKEGELATETNEPLT